MGQTVEAPCGAGEGEPAERDAALRGKIGCKITAARSARIGYPKIWQVLDEPRNIASADRFIEAADDRLAAVRRENAESCTAGYKEIWN
jgi:ribulose kinase